MSEHAQIPGIIIAGTHSGCGKTTVARGLMQAFRERGFVVQPCKVGPDFIDPSHHTAICGRVSRNLDPFMMGEEGVVRSYVRACRGADIAVVEGVMGMFDGLDGTAESSTAHVAELLSLPVLLVVDVRGMSRSAHAVVRGFCSMPGGERIRGVIFNRLGSPRHRDLIERTLGPLPVGWMKRREGLEVRSRHLGLVMASEVVDDGTSGNAVAEDCDLDEILRIARSAPPLCTGDEMQPGGGDRPVIGIARDEAFCFYYQDNLDSLVAAGADLCFFSPVRGEMPEMDALYLGGGYPELHAAALANSPAMDGIRAAADQGMPIYGECGGLLALAGSITTDREYRMAGVLPATATMTGSVAALGYSDGRATGRNSFVHEGMQIRGHEFHYSRVECPADARFLFRLTRGKGIAAGMDGLFEHETVGSYTHSYFSAEFSGAFVSAARKFRAGP